MRTRIANGAYPLALTVVTTDAQVSVTRVSARCLQLDAGGNVTIAGQM